MKRVVLVVCAVLAACESEKHDPVKQVTLLRDCIQAHTGLPAGTVGNMKIDMMKGGVIVYCENFADQNSIVEKNK